MAQLSPSPHDVYSEQLSVFRYGLAIWEPHPNPIWPPVMIGDVGYMFYGRFKRLFNIHLPHDHRYQPETMPEQFETLPLDQSHIDTHRHLQPGVYYSRSVRARTVSGQLDMQRGAILVLPHPAERADATIRGRYKKYIWENFDRWFAYTQLLGLDLRLEDIIAVTGRDMTTAWSMAAFTSENGHAAARLTVNVDSVGSLGASAGMEWTNVQNAVFNWGPTTYTPTSLPSQFIEGPGPSTADSLSQGHTDPAWLSVITNAGVDQCIFVRGYHIKRRLRGVVKTIEAFAEHRENGFNGDGEDGPDGAGVTHQSEYEIVALGDSESSQCHNVWEPLLDYILQDARVDLAIVHDDDLIPYLTDYPDNLAVSAAIIRQAPRVVIYDRRNARDEQHKGLITGMLEDIALDDPHTQLHFLSSACNQDDDPLLPVSTSIEEPPTGKAQGTIDGAAVEGGDQDIVRDKCVKEVALRSNPNQQSTSPANPSSTGAHGTSRPSNSNSVSIPRRKHPLTYPTWPSLAEVARQLLSMSSVSLPAPLMMSASASRGTSYMSSYELATVDAATQLKSELRQPEPLLKRAADGTVEAGTLQGLVRRLTMNTADPLEDADFRSMFLTAYQLFTTSEELFGVLQLLFEEANGGEKVTAVSRKTPIILFLKTWLKEDHDDLDERVMALIQEFARSIRGSEMIPQAKEIVEIVEDRLCLLGAESHSVTQTIAANVEPAHAGDITPSDLAIALTAVENRCYAAIRERDVVLHVLNSHNEHIRAALVMNNRIINWVKVKVLKSNDMKNRADTFKFFVNAAEECRKLGNFSSMSAIVTALRSATMADSATPLMLTRSWNLSTSAKRVLRYLEDLLAPSSNHLAYREAYREACRESTLQIIPWLATHLHYLTVVSDRLPPAIEVDGRVMINFKRCTVLITQIRAVLDKTGELPSPRAGVLVYLQHELNATPPHGVQKHFDERSSALAQAEKIFYDHHMGELREVGFPPARSTREQTGRIWSMAEQRFDARG
ncbi:ras GEF [Auriscalpium vulgare]|uniref:Ras GEF n=1 Tax=Auriscalpium vulgare TaxID=40419 RepID=A0ACB8S6X9_9AGAM|nr:ras GEF [Auriscalpium vulgare]